MSLASRDGPELSNGNETKYEDIRVGTGSRTSEEEFVEVSSLSPPSSIKLHATFEYLDLRHFIWILTFLTSESDINGANNSISLPSIVCRFPSWAMGYGRQPTSKTSRPLMSSPDRSRASLASILGTSNVLAWVHVHD